MDSKRNKYMDISKGLGMLAVIIAHIGTGWVRTFFYTFHLPLFFIISGYFLKPQEQFGIFIKKKIKGYFVPYVCCSILLSVFQFVHDGYSMYSLKNNLMAFLVQRRFTTLWFLAALFLSSILFWVICKICKENLIKTVCVCAVLSGIFIFYDLSGRKPLPWNIDTSFIVLIYLVFGRVLRQKELINRLVSLSSLKRIAAFAAFLGINIGCSVGNFLLCHNTYEMYEGRYGVFPLTIIAACAGTVAVITLASFLEHLKIVEWTAGWIGKNSMAFFAFHQTIGITLMTDICKKIRLSKGIYTFVFDWKEQVLIFFGVMLICYVMHLFFTKLKMGFILGKYR
jgi:fucose 4-O-acetylase-like acetyltransferase